MISSQSMCQKHLFVEIKSKADYQRVMPYFYIEIEDTLGALDLCSLSNLDSSLVEVLNRFDKRKYVNFFTVGTFPEVSEESADSSILNFEEAQNNYHYFYYESKNYEIKLSIDSVNKNLDIKEIKSSNGFIIPEFYINNGNLRYKSIESKGLNIILRFE